MQKKKTSSILKLFFKNYIMYVLGQQIKKIREFTRLVKQKNLHFMKQVENHILRGYRYKE